MIYLPSTDTVTQYRDKKSMAGLTGTERLRKLLLHLSEICFVWSVSLKVPRTHRPCHWPTGSVMHLVSDARWVGVVEGTLLQGRMAAAG